MPTRHKTPAHIENEPFLQAGSQQLDQRRRGAAVKRDPTGQVWPKNVMIFGLQMSTF